MILLDSDRLTILKDRGSERYVRRTERLQSSDDKVGTTNDGPQGGLHFHCQSCTFLDRESARFREGAWPSF